ncbi:MAG TPA: RidA family protein [Bdellovibrionota bacterium]|nr:RidA family protein [Bdellovibrionota bacterium]
MSSKVVATNQAPAAIGPYSQGIITGGFLYTAGQIPLDPKTGQMITGDMKAQTKRVFENLKAVLSAAGTDFRSVVKATVYLVSMDDFPLLNEVYSEYLGDTKPARSTVAVAALPKGAKVEIDLVARIAE